MQPPLWQVVNVEHLKKRREKGKKTDQKLKKRRVMVMLDSLAHLDRGQPHQVAARVVVMVPCRLPAQAPEGVGGTWALTLGCPIAIGVRGLNHEAVRTRVDPAQVHVDDVREACKKKSESAKAKEKRRDLR